MTGPRRLATADHNRPVLIDKPLTAAQTIQCHGLIPRRVISSPARRKGQDRLHQLPDLRAIPGHQGSKLHHSSGRHNSHKGRLHSLHGQIEASQVTRLHPAGNPHGQLPVRQDQRRLAAQQARQEAHLPGARQVLQEAHHQGVLHRHQEAAPAAAEAHQAAAEKGNKESNNIDNTPPGNNYRLLPGGFC